MDVITSVLLWAWEAGNAVRDGLVFLFDYVKEFLSWLFDVQKVVDVGVYMVSTIWAFVESKLPSSASDALNGFVAMLHFPQVLSLVKVAIWVLDQFTYASVIMAIFMAMFVIVPGLLLLRLIVFVLHQLWGTGDGS